MIKLICVGKVKEKSLSSLIQEYLKRIQPYHKLQIIEVKDEPTSDDEFLNKRTLENEGQSILKNISDRDLVVLIDLHGKMYDSYGFAKKINDYLNRSQKDICFVIGGSLGFGDNIRKRANDFICLSELTFPHQIVRLLVLEQIYRAFKINNNESYHK